MELDKYLWTDVLHSSYALQVSQIQCLELLPPPTHHHRHGAEMLLLKADRVTDRVADFDINVNIYNILRSTFILQNQNLLKHDLLKFINPGGCKAPVGTSSEYCKVSM